MRRVTEFHVGQLVQVGEARPLDRSVVWRITHIDKAYGTAVVVSGMTERRAVYALNRLVPFRPRVMEPAS